VGRAGESRRILLRTSPTLQLQAAKASLLNGPRIALLLHGLLYSHFETFPFGTMKSLILAFTGLFLGIASSFGATAEVQWGTLDVANGFGTANGTPLPAGDIALVGSFNITPAQITANGGDESFLMSHFITFGTAHIGDGIAVPEFQPGYFIGDNTADSNGLGINNAQIYYWVFNSTTAATATQYGIFTDPSGANPNSNNWRFPDTGSVTPITVTDISDVPQNASGILWGGYGVGTSSNGADPLYNLATFTAVPEPSSFALFGLGAVGLALIRRRAKR
jgi:hypothetical protein